MKYIKTLIVKHLVGDISRCEDEDLKKHQILLMIGMLKLLYGENKNMSVRIWKVMARNMSTFLANHYEKKWLIISGPCEVSDDYVTEYFSSENNIEQLSFVPTYD